MTPDKTVWTAEVQIMRNKIYLIGDFLAEIGGKLNGKIHPSDYLIEQFNKVVDNSTPISTHKEILEKLRDEILNMPKYPDRHAILMLIDKLLDGGE